MATEPRRAPGLPTSDVRQPSGLGRAFADLLAPSMVYLAVALYVTWPLPAIANDHVVKGPILYDLLLVIWILRWDLHALATDPLHLFSANALHPERYSLATTEHLVGDVPLFAPTWWLTGNSVLALNVLTLASFVLAGLFMHILVHRWTGSRAAAYVAGLAFAFAPWRLRDGLQRPHLLQVQYLPLIMLGLDRIARDGRWAFALATGAVLALQGLCSYYVAYPALFMAAAFVVADLLVRGLRGRSAVLLRYGLACGAIPLAVLIPFSLPYLANQASGIVGEGGVFGSEAAIAASLREQAGHPFRITLDWWVGIGPALVAPLALLGLRRRSDRSEHTRARIVALLLTAVVGYFLAAGPEPWTGIDPFLWLRSHVPGLASIRAPGRFAILVSLAASALAGLGTAFVGNLLWSRGWRHAHMVSALASASLVLVPLGYLPPLQGTAIPVGEAIPQVYRWLDRHGRGAPLLEIPMGSALTGAYAMYFSTYHWLPLLNGHTGYYPPSFEVLRDKAARLPREDSLGFLVRCTELGWILVHNATPAKLEPWMESKGVRLRASFASPRHPNPDRLFEVLLDSSEECEHPLLRDAALGRSARAPQDLGPAR